MAARASSRVGCGLRFSSATAETTWPGVQKPHCGDSSSMKACCTGCNVAIGAAHTLDGGTLRPRTLCVSTEQELWVMSSSMTVQAPHSPRSQPSLVPVSPSL